MSMQIILACTCATKNSMCTWSGSCHWIYLGENGIWPPSQQVWYGLQSITSPAHLIPSLWTRLTLKLWNHMLAGQLCFVYVQWPQLLHTQQPWGEYICKGEHMSEFSYFNTAKMHNLGLASGVRGAPRHGYQSQWANKKCGLRAGQPCKTPVMSLS